MPNLGAGVDQHVNTTALPTWVYQAPAYISGSPVLSSLRLYNEGTNVLFVGGANVSPFNGFPIPPGSKPVEIQNASGTIYTCGNSIVGANTAAGTASAAVAAGASSIPVSSYSTAITIGSTIIYGAGASAAGYEVLVVSATAATTITTSTPLLYDHATAVKFTLATTTIGQLRVTAGN
jgi:hypothetical protein